MNFFLMNKNQNFFQKEIFFSADHESFVINELNERYLNSFVINVTNPINNSNTANTFSTSDETSPPSSPNLSTIIKKNFDFFFKLDQYFFLEN